MKNLKQLQEIYEEAMTRFYDDGKKIEEETVEDLMKLHSISFNEILILCGLKPIK